MEGEPFSTNPAERAVMALFELLDVPGLVNGDGITPGTDQFILRSALGILDDRYIALYDAHQALEA